MLESGHRDGMRCSSTSGKSSYAVELELPEPELPVVLRETEQVEVEAQPEPRWRRLLKRQKANCGRWFSALSVQQSSAAMGQASPQAPSGKCMVSPDHELCCVL